ncbi:hypothetical protein B0T40_15710 [Chromobacterium haemolyticum]|uniref:phage protease n=1 Tax=Chromobacterium haemolyticum TaxID=394935 RepID=UPI0009DB5B77|nr:phage protease [Chromobacterium haemolyticum]OQS34288.1 hypothetical protein B0T40_15710 [Chromobacterium haemolyticum]
MPHLTHFIAALTVDLSKQAGTEGKAPRVVKLIPAGSFRARDGRPVEVPAWKMDSVQAAILIAEAAARRTRYVIDYEHQTLRSIENGKPAPAAGWFTTLEWRDDGLYAVDVEWTASAAAMIEADEYLYISPVFPYDKEGRVTGLLHVALTNNPALDELPDLQVAALSRLVSLTQSVKQEDSTMDELIEQLRWLLNLPVGATADDIKAQLQKLIEQLSGGQGTAAASIDLLQLLTNQQARIATLSATQVDPARFVSVETMRALQEQVAALTAQQQGRVVEDLVTVALSDGRLLPVQEEWARGLGKSNLDALQSYLASAPKIAALSTTQTQGKPPAADPETGLDADTLAVCSMFGNDPAAVAAAMKE